MWPLEVAGAALLFELQIKSSTVCRRCCLKTSATTPMDRAAIRTCSRNDWCIRGEIWCTVLASFLSPETKRLDTMRSLNEQLSHNVIDRFPQDTCHAAKRTTCPFRWTSSACWFLFSYPYLTIIVGPNFISILAVRAMPRWYHARCKSDKMRWSAVYTN